RTTHHNDDWIETLEWIRDLPVGGGGWGEWVPYRAPDGSGEAWTTPPQDYGFYVFAIRAKDEAGAITPVFAIVKNVRYIIVREIVGGPILTLSNSYIYGLVTSTCPTPVTILDYPAGVPIDFEFAADASYYGGVASTYRYGWDIANPDDPESWPMDWTPFPPHSGDEPARALVPPITFFGNTHRFRLEVKDEFEQKSCLEVTVDYIDVNMNKDLLLVDDFEEPAGSGWNNPAGKGFLPNDAEHDQFWLNAVSEVASFNPAADVIDVSEVGGAGLTLDRLLEYKSIIWSVYGWADAAGDLPYLSDLIMFQPKEASAPSGNLWVNPLALYMAAGGHILIAGVHPVKMSINRDVAPRMRFPVMFQYELDLRGHNQHDTPDVSNPPGDLSFPFRELCLETMEFAYVDQTLIRGSRLVCSNANDRTLDNSRRDHTMRAAIPLHPGIPRLELRPETASPGKAHAADI
ncbi:MAG: hypothetical protein KAJ17_00460, partial [Candidatus Krumholzibacteria bacterium]|nr:hypothetical protein [Candidatus Krumholzibacteria bacterium]